MSECANKIVAEFNLIIAPQNLSITLDRIFLLLSIFLVFTNTKYTV